MIGSRQDAGLTGRAVGEALHAWGRLRRLIHLATAVDNHPYCDLHGAGRRRRIRPVGETN
jgi:hypothetical protein